MKKNDWKKREGVVYSTDSAFTYDSPQTGEQSTLAPEKQLLRIFIDQSGRAGKQVTIVAGFVGTSLDLGALCKQLKTKCGTGGSVKRGEILIQGDLREKVVKFLGDEGYGAK